MRRHCGWIGSDCTVCCSQPEWGAHFRIVSIRYKKTQHVFNFHELNRWPQLRNGRIVRWILRWLYFVFIGELGKRTHFYFKWAQSQKCVLGAVRFSGDRMGFSLVLLRRTNGFARSIIIRQPKKPRQVWFYLTILVSIVELKSNTVSTQIYPL